jgi:hypothetical protein
LKLSHTAGESNPAHGFVGHCIRGNRTRHDDLPKGNHSAATTIYTINN